jgi:hypothetical protein
VHFSGLPLPGVGRANLDGSPAEDGFINNAAQPCDVEVNATHIYWASRLNHSIVRANIDGTGSNPNFITGLGDPCGIALDVEPEPPETAITAKPRKRTRKRTATYEFTPPTSPDRRSSAASTA